MSAGWTTATTLGELLVWRTRLRLAQKPCTSRGFFFVACPHTNPPIVGGLVWGYNANMKPFDIEQAKQAAETVAKKHGLSFVALFGSQATGD